MMVNKENSIPVSKLVKPSDCVAANLRSKAGPLSSDAAPMGSKAGPLRSDAAPTGSKAGPLRSDAAPMGSKAGPLSSDAAPMGSKAGLLRSDAAPMGRSGQESRRKKCPNCKTENCWNYCHACLNLKKFGGTRSVKKTCITRPACLKKTKKNYTSAKVDDKGDTSTMADKKFFNSAKADKKTDTSAMADMINDTLVKGGKNNETSSKKKNKEAKASASAKVGEKRKAEELEEELMEKRYLNNWVPLLRNKKLYIEGDLINVDSLTPSEMSVKWTTSKIVSRISEKMMSTKKTCYVLEGQLAIPAPAERPLPLFVIDKLKNGFPENWKNIIQLWIQMDEDEAAKVASHSRNITGVSLASGRMDTPTTERANAGETVRPQEGAQLGVAREREHRAGLEVVGSSVGVVDQGAVGGIGGSRSEGVENQAPAQGGISVVKENDKMKIKMEIELSTAQFIEVAHVLPRLG